MSERTPNKLIQKLPKLIFMDTNVLDSLPENLRSGEFSLLLENAATLDVGVVVSQIALLEWLKHRREGALKHLRRIRAGRDYISRYKNDALNIRIDDATLQGLVTEQQNNLLKKLGIEIAPLPSIDVEEIATNAVEEIPPFKKEDRGFKDELIVLSLIEYAQKLESPSAILISNDSIFSKQALKERFKSKNIELIVVTSLDEANKWFDNYLVKVGEVYDEEKRKKAYQFVQKHWDQIRDAIMEHVEEVGAYDKNLFPSGEIPPVTSVSEILKVDPLGIDRVALGYGRPVLLDLPVETPITIYVKVKFDIEIETYTGDFWEDALLGRKVGFEGSLKKMSAFRKVSMRQTTEPTVRVEATALKDAHDNFSNFRLSQVLL